MPRFDGTGPRGQGPGTGRGRGVCGVISILCDGRRPPGRIVLSLAATLAGVITQDAMNPEGISRKLIRTLRGRFASRLREPETDAMRTVRTVDAEVLPGPINRNKLIYPQNEKITGEKAPALDRKL